MKSLNIEVGTHLSLDVADVLVRRWRYLDHLNDLYDLEVDVIATDPIDSKELLLQQVLLNFVDQPHFHPLHGVIGKFALLACEQDGGYVYRLHIVPSWWTVHGGVRCQIFQQQTTLEMVAEVLAGSQSPPLKAVLSAQPPVLGYRVQWHESNLDFAWRLLSEAGLTVWFQTDSVQVTDDTSTIEERFTCPFKPQAGALMTTEQCVLSVQFDATVGPVQTVIRDYDFLRPNYPLRALALHAEKAGGMSSVHYRPGTLIADEMGPPLRLLQQQRTGVTQARMRMNCAVQAGTAFRMVDHPQAEINGAWLVVETMTEIADDGTRTCWANVVPLHEPWRPPPVEKPCISGTQSAVVAGAEGKEIDTDSFGRVRVHFFWDERVNGMSDWIRCVQGWGGGGAHGHLWIPRVGAEVLVTFEGGDPERPVIVGCAYNQVHMPPVPLPENQTMSGIISTTVGGTGHNALVFQDQAGKEMFYGTTDGQMILSAKTGMKLLVGGLPLNTPAGGASPSLVQDGHFALYAPHGIGMGTAGSFSVGAEGQIEFTAGTKITLTCGSSSIVLEDGKITITAPNVTIVSDVCDINP